MTELPDEDGSYVCERCGAVKVKSTASTCTCGGRGPGERILPEGWDSEPTRSDRPRLPLSPHPRTSQ